MSEPGVWVVEACDPESELALPLLAALSGTLEAITGSSGAASFDPADVRSPGALFVVARDCDGRALGCGAFRPLEPGVAEVKRMFAVPGSRGVGSAILAHLEAQGLAGGYHIFRLETRLVNVRAVRFYERRGYRRIANFGRYAGRPEAACFEKRLVA